MSGQPPGPGRLRGRTVVITGAARCAGHAPARAWTADVTAHDRMRAVAA
jgi:hypothetical protein